MTTTPKGFKNTRISDLNKIIEFNERVATEMAREVDMSIEEVVANNGGNTPEVQFMNYIIKAYLQSTYELTNPKMAKTYLYWLSAECAEAVGVNAEQLGVEDVTLFEPFAHYVPAIVTLVVLIGQCVGKEMSEEEASKACASVNIDALAAFGNTVVSDFFTKPHTSGVPLNEEEQDHIDEYFNNKENN